jgi:hypothetical protein
MEPGRHLLEGDDGDVDVAPLDRGRRLMSIPGARRSMSSSNPRMNTAATASGPPIVKRRAEVAASNGSELALTRSRMSATGRAACRRGLSA